MKMSVDYWGRGAKGMLPPTPKLLGVVGWSEGAG